MIAQQVTIPSLSTTHKRLPHPFTSTFLRVDKWNLQSKNDTSRPCDQGETILCVCKQGL